VVLFLRGDGAFQTAVKSVELEAIARRERDHAEERADVVKGKRWCVENRWYRHCSKDRRAWHFWP
jgi:hypothetical protein